MPSYTWLSESNLQNTSWNDVRALVSPHVCAALERVLGSLDGRRISREECDRLANVAGDDLFGLAIAANEIRRRLVGDVVSYVITRNINFTNVCFVGCKFCAFGVGPQHESAYFLSLDEIGRKCREAQQWGA